MSQPSQVGSRTGARAVGGGFPAELFRLRGGFTMPPWPLFPPPPRQTQRADFPPCAFLLGSCEGLWDLSHWERLRLRPTHSVGVKQPQRVIQPSPTPPLPAKALAVPRTHQMPPHLLFHPIFDQAKASGGVSHGTVAHPAPQNRVDQVDHPRHRLGLVAPEDVLQLAQACRPLLLPRRIPRTPDSSAALDTSKVKAQEAAGFTMGQVDNP